MTGPGEQQGQQPTSDAWWNEAQPQQAGQADPTMLRQPSNPAMPQQPYPGQQSQPGIPQQPYSQPGVPQQPYPGQQSQPGVPQADPTMLRQPTGATLHQPVFPGVPQQQGDPSAWQQPTGYPGTPQQPYQPGYQQVPPPSAPYNQVPPGYPQGPATGSGGRKGWLWALGAVLVTSAVWAVGVFAFGVSGDGVSANADLRGYHYVDNLCDFTDTSPFTSAGYSSQSTGTSTDKDKYPKHDGTKHAAVDTMSCAYHFSPPGSASASDYGSLYTHAELHKQTDPGPEFTASNETWTQRSTGKDSKVEKISGIGDEAYLIKDKTTSGLTGVNVTLVVRDGWVTYSTSYFQFNTSTDKSKVPSEADITEKLKKSAPATLAKLRR
ncbi:hypothetical protein [Nocardia sp. NPDC052566]|uniref:hypothetical protein n=1 Tax=Nocardia sp. NPDC052566 TaxID=3364330 RepID=UPI0037C7C215